MKNVRLLLICQFCLVIGFGVLRAQQTSKPTRDISFPTASPSYAKAKITSELLPSEGNTWGFDIFVDGKRFIHQLSKPGLPGNRGFTTKIQAQRVANLMIKKIRKGEMPPSITIEEMKKLKAI